MAVCLAFFAPTSNSRVHAQVTVYRYQDGGYYQPYGQGPYGGYNQGYAAPAPAHSGMFPSRSGTFGRRSYGSAHWSLPSEYSNRIDHGIRPPVRVYGQSSYYQPSYGPMYGPFGYSSY